MSAARRRASIIGAGRQVLGAGASAGTRQCSCGWSARQGLDFSILLFADELACSTARRVGFCGFSSRGEVFGANPSFFVVGGLDVQEAVLG